MSDESFRERLTARLRLTRMGPSHAAAFAAYRAEPEVARFQSWGTFTREDADAFVQRQLGQHPDAPGQWFQFAIEEQDSGALLGDCALHTLASDPRLGEIGFTIAPAHQRRGVGFEAVSALLGYAFDERQKHRIEATTDVGNDASRALREKLGVRREAHHRKRVWFKGAWGDEYVYALLREEWRAAVR
ncbi:MAG: GNAT family protein [Myxococcota bacterium]